MLPIKLTTGNTTGITPPPPHLLFIRTAPTFSFSRIEYFSLEMTKAQRLRYQVYCLEKKFLDAASYPDGREYDEHDRHCLQIVAQDFDQEIIGTIRLISDSPAGFPFLSHCGGKLYPGLEYILGEKTAEVSRLVIDKRYRCFGTDKTKDQNQYPVILFGMFRQMYEASIQIGIRYWVAAMEPRLARMLRFYGFVFKPIGESTDYFGEVRPYIGDLRELETSRIWVESF